MNQNRFGSNQKTFSQPPGGRRSFLRLFTGFAVLVLAGCATPEVAVNQHADFSKIRRVAVATFSGSGGDVAADLLTQDLLNHGADVVERQRLDAVLNEQHLASDGLLNPATVKKIGEIRSEEHTSELQS